MKHEDLTNKIIHAFFKVYNTLGYGFLERVYRNALYFELLEMGINANMEKRILVYYKTHVVGEYCADLMVEDAVICELKTSEALCEADENQLINYLRATNVEVGLLLNFGKKAEVRRKSMIMKRSFGVQGERVKYQRTRTAQKKMIYTNIDKALATRVKSVVIH
jgi:GxxExxY protein